MSLRFGKYALKQAGELKSLKKYADLGNSRRTSRIEWVERNATTDRTRDVTLPKFDPRYGLAETDEIPVSRKIRDELHRSN